MSVHDDGPPAWKKPPEPKPDPSAASSEWVSLIAKAADELLVECVARRSTITSLAFKLDLRRRCVDIEPAPRITQEDVSKYLKRWFLGIDVVSGLPKLDDAEHSDVGGPAYGYAFLEHFTGGPEKNKTYNEYYFDPSASDGRVKESEGEAAIVTYQLGGRVPKAWAWIKDLFHRDTDDDG